MWSSAESSLFLLNLRLVPREIGFDTLTLTSLSQKFNSFPRDTTKLYHLTMITSCIRPYKNTYSRMFFRWYQRSNQRWAKERNAWERNRFYPSVPGTERDGNAKSIFQKERNGTGTQSEGTRERLRSRVP